MSLYPSGHLGLCAQANDPPPFIETQTIYRLVIGPQGLREGEKKRCVELGPKGERQSRQKQLRLEGQPELTFSKGATWKRNPGPEQRQRLLATGKLKHLCLLVNAGTGKTTALRQTQCLRQLRRGHLAIGCEFAELPTNADDFWAFCVNVFRYEHEDLQRIDEDSARKFLVRLAGSGKLSLLIDALDQHANRDQAKKQAEALSNFLRVHPRMRCVITGRPTSVTQFWTALGFDSPDWHFGWIAEFSKEERNQFVGAERLRAIAHLEADFQASPRMLSHIRGRDPMELSRYRTWSELFVQLDEETLRTARRDRPDLPSVVESRRLFALAAWELLIRHNTDGIHTPEEFEKFLSEVWKNRRDELPGQPTWKEFKDDFDRLGELNEITDFAITFDGARQRLVFRSRTLQDFYAALWITRYSSDPKDLTYLREQIDSNGQTEFWRFMTGMPPSEVDSQNAVLARAFRVLFERPPLQEGKDLPNRRPCELMWRCWPRLLQLAGCQLPDDWTEPALTKAAQALAHRAHDGKSPPRTKSEARQIALQTLWEFWGEFADLCGRADEVGHVARTLRYDAARDASNESASGWYRHCPPAGESHRFSMGSAEGEGNDDEHPRHEVELTPFFLRKFTVTNREFQLFDPGQAASVRANDGAFDGRPFDQPNQPATGISWYDAVVYCRWLGPGMRLPTEAEWEFSCRSGTETAYSFRNAEEQLSDFGWWGGVLGEGNAKAEKYPHPGGLKRANAWGLYDLHGNVWEWCADWYGKYESRLLKDPPGPSTGSRRVIRGGGWIDDAFYCRSADRDGGLPGFRSSGLGFRMARVPSSQVGAAERPEGVVQGEPFT